MLFRFVFDGLGKLVADAFYQQLRAKDKINLNGYV